MPSPGLVVIVFAFVTIVPMAVLTFVPAMLFRVYFRRNRRLWTRRFEHVVRAIYRGSAVEIDAPSHVPAAVSVVSLASLYLAVPVLVVGPLSFAAVAEHGLRGDALVGVTCSLLMIASAIVGCAILRPSREAVLGARVVAASEVLFALGAAWLEWTPLAIVAAAHALALLVGAFANQRGNVQKCA